MTKTYSQVIKSHLENYQFSVEQQTKITAALMTLGRNLNGSTIEDFSKKNLESLKSKSGEDLLNKDDIALIVGNKDLMEAVSRYSESVNSKPKVKQKLQPKITPPTTPPPASSTDKKVKQKLQPKITPPTTPPPASSTDERGPELIERLRHMNRVFGSDIKLGRNAIISIVKSSKNEVEALKMLQELKTVFKKDDAARNLSEEEITKLLTDQKMLQAIYEYSPPSGVENARNDCLNADLFKEILASSVAKTGQKNAGEVDGNEARNLKDLSIEELLEEIDLATNKQDEPHNHKESEIIENQPKESPNAKPAGQDDQDLPSVSELERQIAEDNATKAAKDKDLERQISEIATEIDAEEANILQQIEDLGGETDFELSAIDSIAKRFEKEDLQFINRNKGRALIVNAIKGSKNIEDAQIELKKLTRKFDKNNNDRKLTDDEIIALLTDKNLLLAIHNIDPEATPNLEGLGGDKAANARFFSFSGRSEIIKTVKNKSLEALAPLATENVVSATSNPLSDNSGASEDSSGVEIVKNPKIDISSQKPAAQAEYKSDGSDSDEDIQTPQEPAERKIIARGAGGGYNEAGESSNSPAKNVDAEGQILELLIKNPRFIQESQKENPQLFSKKEFVLQLFEGFNKKHGGEEDVEHEFKTGLKSGREYDEMQNRMTLREALKYASESLRDDPDVVAAAKNLSDQNLQYATARFQPDSAPSQNPAAQAEEAVVENSKRVEIDIIKQSPWLARDEKYQTLLSDKQAVITLLTELRQKYGRQNPKEDFGKHNNDLMEEEYVAPSGRFNKKDQKKLGESVMQELILYVSSDLGNDLDVVRAANMLCSSNLMHVSKNLLEDLFLEKHKGGLKDEAENICRYWIRDVPDIKSFLQEKAKEAVGSLESSTLLWETKSDREEENKPIGKKKPIHQLNSLGKAEQTRFLEGVADYLGAPKNNKGDANANIRDSSLSISKAEKQIIFLTKAVEVLSESGIEGTDGLEMIIQKLFANQDDDMTGEEEMQSEAWQDYAQKSFEDAGYDSYSANILVKKAVENASLQDADEKSWDDYKSNLKEEDENLKLVFSELRMSPALAEKVICETREIIALKPKSSLRPKTEAAERLSEDSISSLGSQERS